MFKNALKKTAWLKFKLPLRGGKYLKVKKIAAANNLATVCAAALCPNIAHCWNSGAAAFMIMGNTCTRACRFCSVNHGRPGPLDVNEPEKLASGAVALKLNYVVITSVDRDDLPDSGAGHFAECVRAVKKKLSHAKVETLTGDFRGRQNDIQTVLNARPDVFAHNLETVERLTRQVRDIRAAYEQSLFVLRTAKQLQPCLYTKSSLMVGLGETQDEIKQAMDDLRRAGVDFLTIGQYLRPAEWNISVKEYVPPEQFDEYRAQGLEMGFSAVAAGPFVRSSYMAAEMYNEAIKKSKKQ